MITWGFDMSTAYEDFNVLFMLMSLISIMNGHVFQSANEPKGIGLRPASANSVSNQH